MEKIIRSPSRPEENMAADRAGLVRLAFRLEWLTAAWMALEAAVAIGSGVAAHSLSLIAFGVDSVIELASAGVLLWRLTVEIKRGEKFSEAAERRASIITATLLAALVIYVLVSAGYGLWRRGGQDFSVTGLILTVLAIPVMYALAKKKLRIAAQIGSRALRADAVEAVTCGYLSGTLLLGLLAQFAIGAWWIDSVTALALVPFLVREAKEAWEAD